MEKKRNHVARNGLTNTDFKSKNQDVSNKQFPRQRRRESYQSENNKQQSNKNRISNFHYDKRPPARKGNGLDQSTSASCETSGLMEANEYNSVFNQGSRKQNLNHLLNFHYYTARDTDEVRAGTFSKHGYHHHRSILKKYNFNKEQYLQANCQFVVKNDVTYDYRRFTILPDALVEWDQVVKIYVSSTEESQCPICLYPPKAAKMTRCGHIFCFACILHYLSLSDKTWRKCPICYESVHLQDLKSATSKHNHRSYKVGDIISMELMTREKGSLYVTRANEVCVNKFPNFSDSEERLIHSKLIMANPNEIYNIINQEKSELRSQLIEDGIDCPESIFIQQAINLLEEKQKGLEKTALKDKSIEVVSSSLNPSVPDFVPIHKAENICEDSSLPSRDDFIDNDCNLTINDIDIIPAANNTTSKHFYYYQAPNAQNVFLHTINSRMLQAMFGSLDKSPHKIQGRIVQIECGTMNDDLRKRLKYLQHLPVSSVFEIVEIEFEPDLISPDVFAMFKDELLNRRKSRQRRERDERKHEKAINEINERRMGKLRKTVSANIDIASPFQFPDCNFSDMPALPSSVSDCSVSPAFSSSPAGPSFATMLTSPTDNKSEKLWPSLSSGDTSSMSFFGDLKVPRNVVNKENQKTTSQSSDNDDDDDENLIDDETLFKVPAYRHQLGDCLANALAKSATLKETSKPNNKKKKAKKTLLFASGMNFN